MSRAQYNSWIRNGATGARRLDLPIVDTSAGTSPIDLIRRARPNEPAGLGTPFQERFFRLASLRILISDTAADFNNIPTMTADPPVDLSALVPGTTAGYDIANAPPSASDGAAGTVLGAGVATLRGFIKIERQRPDGITWNDVTMEILNLGIAGRNLSTGVLNTPDTNVCTGNEPFPNAIIHLQRVRDVPARGAPCGIQAAADAFQPAGPSRAATDYWPTVLFDAREASRRENDNPGAGNLLLSGVMHYVELDVNNLKKWFEGTTGTTGGPANTMNTTGYVVYFSDRRGNRNAGVETGEFGYENIVNRALATGVAANDLGLPETGEDFNGNGVLDVYGGTPHPGRRRAPRQHRDAAHDRQCRRRPQESAGVLPAGAQAGQRRPGPAALRRQAGADRGLREPRLRAGQLQRLRRLATAICAAGGFGNAPGVDHVSAAVMADAVTLLSTNWNDIRSFTQPYAPGGRPGNDDLVPDGRHLGQGHQLPPADQQRHQRPQGLRNRWRRPQLPALPRELARRPELPRIARSACSPAARRPASTSAATSSTARRRAATTSRPSSWTRPTCRRGRRCSATSTP